MSSPALVEEPYPMSEGLETMVEGQRRKSAPRGAVTPDARGLADRKDNDRLMAIMPVPTDPSSTCTAPHVDGCPECVVNYEPPEVRVPIEDGCRCAYVCSDCGHAWTTEYGRCH